MTTTTLSPARSLARQARKAETVWEDDLFMLTPESADAFPCENDEGPLPEIIGGDKVTLLDANGHKMATMPGSLALREIEKGTLAHVAPSVVQVVA